MSRRDRSSLLRPSITRRDFVNGTLAGAGMALLGCPAPGRSPASDGPAPLSLPPDWYGYGGVGDYRLSHGNTPETVRTAHQIRDGGFGAAAEDIQTDEEYDLVIVGGGIAGLSAALEYMKRRGADQSCLMLDNHPIFGGEAKENEFEVDGTTLIGPQGANGFFIPETVTDPLDATGDARYYAELDIPRDLPYRDWPPQERPLGFCKDNYGYLVIGLQERVSVGHFFPATGTASGGWAVDMWERKLADTPLDDGQRRSLMSWYRAGAARHFSSAEKARRFLDRMSYKEFIEKELGLGAAGTGYADLFLASAAGLGSDATSAYAAYQLPMPGLSESLDSSWERQSFPGGNSGYARYFLKRLIPAAIGGENEFGDIITGRIDLAQLDRAGEPLRMRLGATVIDVRHDGPADRAGGVSLLYTRNGTLRRVRARSVIMATGGWINRHVVGDLPETHREAYGRFRHAPFLVANVALNNWRFLHKLGITAAIWERTDEGFGYTCNIRQPMVVGRHQPPLDPDRPAVLSFYTPFYYPGRPIEAQVTQGRTELLLTSYPEFERKIVRQMLELFSPSGFDPARDIAGIILNRWGHAFSVPYPGFYGGPSDGPAPRDVIRRGFGRMAFAHGELDGLQHWGPAADEGRRAFGQVSPAMSG